MPRREVAPIVTYPEFLTKPTEPAPLVTTDGLLSAVYFASALCATIYGLSKFVVTPMSDSLASARHEFATHTGSTLEDLNRRLGTLVSRDPSEMSSGPYDRAGMIESAETDDDVSAHSDPTELFHRDFGTQTSPSVSRRGSSSSLGTGLEQSSTDTAVFQEKQFRMLISHLDEVSAGTDSNKASVESLSKQVKVLSQYLSEMQYQSPYQLSNGLTAKEPAGRREDAVEQFRTDIRSVKGVLLNARNFPTGSGSVRLSGRVIANPVIRRQYRRCQ